MDVFAVLIAIFLKSVVTLSNSQEYFNISRGSEGSTDVFQLPASLCGESKGATECPLLGGRKIGECQCVCNITDEKGVMYKSTFGFYDGQWKCQNNAVLRNNTGCLVVQDSDTMNDPIPTLDRSHQILYLSMQTIPSRCWRYWLEFGNSTYQGCSGIWKPLDKYATERNFIVHFDLLRYFPAKQPLPRGRLIKLEFSRCNDEPVPCFLLKTKGNVSCPVPYIATNSPPLTLATRLSPSSSRTRISTDVTTNLSMSTTRLRDPNAGRSTADDRFLIAGSVSGVIALMIVIGVMMLVIRTCKKKRTAREREGTPRTDEDGNQEMHTYANATSIRNAYNYTDKGLQRSNDPIPVADYINVHRCPDVVSDGLEYEIVPSGESEVCGQKHPSETLNSSVYCSLVPNVYGSLQVPQKTHEDDADGQVIRASQKNENTYQQLNTFSQQSQSEYQALNYKR